MKNIFKKSAVAGLGVVMALSFALPALAAVNNVLFDNGTGNTTVSSGDQMNVNLYVTSAGTDVESVFVKFPGAGGIAEQGVCYDITPDQTGTSPVGGWVINFPVTAPVNSGTWPISFATYGISGDGADNTCSGAVGFGPTSFTGRVTVIASNSSGIQTQNSGGTMASNSVLQSLTNLVAQLTAQVQGLLHPAATAPSTACASYTQANSGTQMGVYSDANVRLQGFLLSQGASIPALKAGASFGFYGPQTASAVSWFNGMNNCH